MPRTLEASNEIDTAPSRTLVGSLLGGKYKVLRLLGEGGVGVVYEAENSWTGRHVALKVLRPEFAVKREVVRRFKREAQAATRIDHPNIVDVLDMGEDRAYGTLYIVQELLTGTDLRCWLDHRGVLPAAEALEIMVPVMAALVAAHRRGIIHRDIKPENIFLVRGPGGQVVPKLIDFGISKILDATSPGPKTTLTGTAVGTPNYMSPEQARGDIVLDGRSDVWSVGAVLYEMLCGRPPFEAVTHTLLLLRIVTERPEPVDVVNPAVTTALADIVHRALEPDTGYRYPTMRALLADLVESPGFGDASEARALPAAVWDELQLAPIARDVARAETVPLLPTPTLPGTRLPLFAAMAGAVAMIAAAFVIPAGRSNVPMAAIHAGMPRSVMAAEPTPATHFAASAPRAIEVPRSAPAEVHTPVVPPSPVVATVARVPAPIRRARPVTAVHVATASPRVAHTRSAHAITTVDSSRAPRVRSEPASAPVVVAPRPSVVLRPLSVYPDE